MSAVIPARFAGACPLCSLRWQKLAPIAPFPERSEHAGRWGHPACVAADEMGLPSMEAAKERIAAIREKLKKERQS